MDDEIELLARVARNESLRLNKNTMRLIERGFAEMDASQYGIEWRLTEAGAKRLKQKS